ncbi:hypothetical protein AKG11_28765 [Shinella sp. SUS2]|uniref:ATP-binding protein n=1 Tax=unclassified Shinella TaxID=2643062 RepID=UPI000681B8FB|nr:MULTISPECIES: ATP-binding protein [unclassified Shinella]KNY13469.1 hypothetical protein AKG11_28765 [Shinella sp. SUS2]KOC71861.1 hypothetical protein AKG10_30535 [Shinella sp. GWS1]
MRFPGFGARTIRGQLMLVVILAIGSVIVAGQVIERIKTFDYADAVDVDLVGQRALTLALLLDGADDAQRQRILARSAEVGIEIDIVPRDALERIAGPDGFRSKIGSFLAYLFPPDGNLPDGSKMMLVGRKPMLSLPINDKEFLLYKSFPDSVLTTDITGRIVYYSLALAILGVLFSIFAVRFLTAPLKAISSEIRDTDAFLSRSTLVPETGSLEIKDLARALNELRTRIHEMIRNRTGMLRSVSHDLRTPLTRVRLRAERIGDAAIRDQILADVEQINTLIDITLDYLRDDRDREACERTDVASIMQTICANFTDMGAHIRYAGPPRLVWHCKPMALSRAITNLCENGIKFGGEVTMSLKSTDQYLSIGIQDRGPGIPEQFATQVLEPFFQMDPARTGNTKARGFGLGLSIVDEIVRDHGGQLEFENTAPRGLSVRIILPKASPRTSD